MKKKISVMGVGMLLGLVLSRSGFSSWDEMHAMFTLAQLRLWQGFGLAVAGLVVLWFVLGRMTGVRWPPRSFHRGTVPGALLFGVGWAITGGCPGVVPVQIGEGQLGALATLIGIFVGNWLYAVLQERWLHWPQQGCAEL